MAVASLLMVPAAAGAASNCTVTETINTPSGCVTPPTVHGNTVAPVNDGGSPAAVSPTSTSLPFTGADVEGLAVVGVGAILAGGLLLRRRRMAV